MPLGFVLWVSCIITFLVFPCSHVLPHSNTNSVHEVAHKHLSQCEGYTLTQMSEAFTVQVLTNKHMLQLT